MRQYVSTKAFLIKTSFFISLAGFYNGTGPGQNGWVKSENVIRSLGNEFQQLIGDVRIMFAMKKRSSIGNSVVRNKQLSIRNNPSLNQRCNSGGCRQCPLTIDQSAVLADTNSWDIPTAKPDKIL